MKNAILLSLTLFVPGCTGVPPPAGGAAPGGEVSTEVEGIDWGVAHVRHDMTREEVLKEIRVVNEAFQDGKIDFWVRPLEDSTIRNDEWLIIAPSRNAEALGGGSGRMYSLMFKGGRVNKIRQWPWLAG